MDIKVEAENLTEVKRKLTVEIPSGDARREYRKILRQFTGMAQLPGFRRGKAPAGVVRARFKEDIRSELFRALIPDAYQAAIEQESLKPLGQPQIEDFDYEEGDPLVFVARLEVLPEFQLPEYRGLEAKVDDEPVTDEVVAAELDKLRDRHSNLVAVEESRPIVVGDYAVIDVSGVHADADPGDEAVVSDEGVVVEVGGEHTQSEFSEALEGMKVGEEDDIEVEYGPDYPEKKLAGRRVSFEISVKEVKRKELPEVNDEFAKDLGDFESLDELKTNIREQLESQRDRKHNAEVKNLLADRILEGVGFEVPDVLVEERIDRRISDVAYNMVSQGVDPQTAQIDWARVRDDFRAPAERDVRLSLVLSRIAEDEGMEVTSEEMDAEIASLAESSGQPVEKVRQRFSKEDDRNGLRRQMLKQKAMDLVQQEART